MMASPAAPGVRRLGLELGHEPRTFSTQTKDSYTWPDRSGKQQAALVFTSTLNLGHASSEYSTTAASAFVDQMTLGFQPSISVLPRANHSVLQLGTDAPSFSTTHRSTFPAHAPVASLKATTSERTADINRAHFTLGYHDKDAPEAKTHKESIHAADRARAEGLLAASFGGAARGESYVPPKMGKFSSVNLDAGVPSDYSTTNTMPVHPEYKKGTPVDPSSWSSFGATSGSGVSAADVYKTLTTSGKPLSAVAFGYHTKDAPVEVPSRAEITRAADRARAEDLLAAAAGEAPRERRSPKQAGVWQSDYMRGTGTEGACEWAQRSGGVLRDPGRTDGCKKGAAGASLRHLKLQHWHVKGNTIARSSSCCS